MRVLHRIRRRAREVAHRAETHATARREHHPRDHHGPPTLHCLPTLSAATEPHRAPFCRLAPALALRDVARYGFSKNIVSTSRVFNRHGDQTPGRPTQ